jgi:collagenase-like PrtC family protease
MIKLSVPFLPEKNYVDFLVAKKTSLESVYFGLTSGPLLDSRVRFSHLDLSSFIQHLMPLKKIKKYCLLNIRFVRPDLYTDTRFLTQLLDTLALVHDKCHINGIVISDFYLVNALAGTGHYMVPLLEAVPGINCMLDSLQKVLSHLELIEQAGFKLPEKLILDRSLNRDPARLNALVTAIKDLYPTLKIELLANEGCLAHCPFKLSHDAQIALSNAGFVKENTHAVNQAIGCHAYFHQHPEKMLSSPFIRPEDMHHYKGMADTLKICGRTLGTRFLTRCITAYCKQRFDGNLMELMDATHFMSDVFDLPNTELGPDFFKTITTCTKVCKKCRICHDFFIKKSKKKSITLKPFKDCQ